MKQQGKVMEKNLSTVHGEQVDAFEESFNQTVALLSAAFGHGLLPVARRVWKEYLSDRLTAQELVESAKIMVVSRQLKESSFPTAQELVEAVKGDASTFIYDQWVLVRKALRQSPGHADYDLIISQLDVVSMRVLEVMGGIGSLRDLDNTALDWARKDFSKMYNQYAPRRQQLECEAIAAKRERERLEQAQAQLDAQSKDGWRRLALSSGKEVEVRPFTAISSMLVPKTEETIPPVKG